MQNFRNRTLIFEQVRYMIFNYCFSTFQYPQKHRPSPTPYHDWDYLMFSQRWPITACNQWEDANKSNTCNIPTDKSNWIVHGIWPTKIGTEGPLFCPSAVHFDPDQLTPIMDELNEHWTNVEANTKRYSFWKHEWDKHGTCAIVMPELNSIMNYFKQGLEWNTQYKLDKMLASNNISPGQTGYTIEQLIDAIRANIKVNPSIQCVTDKNTKESLINEIRICVNKSMDLIDCDITNQGNSKATSILTNCNLKKPIKYLAEVPSKHVYYEMDYVDQFFKKHVEEQLYYMRMYRFLKFLIWMTT